MPAGAQYSTFTLGPLRRWLSVDSIRVIHGFDKVQCIGQQKFQQVSRWLIVCIRVVPGQHPLQNLVLFLIDGTQCDSFYEQVLVNCLNHLMLCQCLTVRIHY